jgi:hypothetical protein
MPGAVLKKAYGKIPAHCRVAFLAAIVAGLLCHIYIMMNHMPNADSLLGYYSAENNVVHGRWFLVVGCFFSSMFNLPFIIGALVLIYYGIAAALLVDLFTLRGKIAIVSVSAILVCFPTVTSGFAYYYLSDGFAMALMLSVLAVWLAARYKRGFLLGGVVLACSMGTYQAYISVAATLILFMLAIKLFDSTDGPKVFFAQAGKYLIMGVLAVVLYYAMVQVTLAAYQIDLSTQHGMDQINNLSNLSVGLLLGGMKQAFVSTYAFFTGQSPYSYPIVTLLVLVYFAFCVVLLGYLLVKRKAARRLWRLASLAGVALVLPIALNLIVIINAGSISYHFLMKSSYSLIFIVGAVFAERYLKIKNNGQNLLRWGAALASLVFITHAILIGNIASSTMQKRWGAEFSVAERLLADMEHEPEYRQNLPLVFHGVPEVPHYRMATEASLYLQGMTGVDYPIILGADFNMYAMFHHYLNVTYERATDEQILDIIATDEFRAMPCWPEDGFLKVIDGVIMVKLQEP